MVFQSYALYPHMTVRENLAFGLRGGGVPRAEIERRVRAVSRTARPSARCLTRKPHALSGGQRQRVALGPRDRPRAEGLPVRRAALQSRRRVSGSARATSSSGSSAELGTTTIYVTHDQVEAMTMGHRICIMNAR